MTPIECAFQAGDTEIARGLLLAEWNRVGDPAKFYYQVIRDGLVATFRHLERSGWCPDWETFCYCSNALLELGVKHVPISEEMEILVLYKLSSFGLCNLCGDPAVIKPANCWLDSIDLIVRWVLELRTRPKSYDFLDVDDQVIFRIRMIHNHLFFVKDKPATRDLPLKEMIFCLAIFIRIQEEIKAHEVYRVMINKRNVMQFLLAIVSRLKLIRNGNHVAKLRKSSVLKKLRKTYKRVKQMYSIFKIVRCAQIYTDINDNDYRRSNASITVATFRRFNQICGEAIKNTTDTSNLSEKISNLLPEVLNESFMLNCKYRNLSSHGVPLSHLFVRDCDRVFYYKYLSDYNYITAVTFYAVCIYLFHDCTRYMYGLMRRCRTIDDLRALIRYAGSDTIRTLQEVMFQKIETYLATVANRLGETNIDDLSFNQKQEYDELRKNYNHKVKVIKQLRNSHRNHLIDAVEVMAFSKASIAAIHRLLDSKLTDSSSASYFETLFSDWKILTTQSIDSTEFTAAIIQSYIHNYLEFDHDCTEQWRYRERTKKILGHFTVDLNLDESTLSTLEDDLHNALSKSRNGYYQNIFALDSKAQAIIKVLKPTIIGPKTSKDFKYRNQTFKLKMEALRCQDEKELNTAFLKAIFNLQEIFRRRNCDSIDLLIKNHGSIPLKERLAIEYWQLQAMEMLYSSGYLGDNFSLLTKSVPMIWGKSYRNYLAHDSLSYNILIASGTAIILINAFVLAFNTSELNIFRHSSTFKLDGLATLEVDGFHWLGLQQNLLNCIKCCDVSTARDHLDRGAELGAEYLTLLGHLLQLKYCALPGIICHEQFDQERIEAIAQLVNFQFPKIRAILSNRKLNYPVKLNLLQFDNTLPIEDAVEQFKMLQPKLITPCIGTVLPHLVSANNFELLKLLIDRHAGSNLKAVLLMTTGHTEEERDFLETHLDCRFSIISELTDGDLNELFTEQYPASDYELGIAIIRNDLRLFKHLIQDLYGTEKAVFDESDLLEAMETCCLHGRTEMVRIIFNIGLECSMFHMSGCLTLAIMRHHWKMVVLLLENDALEWLDDGVNMLSMITEANFRILRQILKNPIPDHLKEKFLSCIVHFGSNRLLKQLDRLGVETWTFKGALTIAAMNRDPEVLKYIEQKMFQLADDVLNSTDLQFWKKTLQDLKMVMIISIDSEFISSIISKKDIAERWIARLVGLLRINDENFADEFHFEDLSELFCPVRSDNYFVVFEDQFHKTAEKCDTFISLIQSLPQDLFVTKLQVVLEIVSTYETIIAEVQFTIHSSLRFHFNQRTIPKIYTQYSCHTADIICMGLRSFLLKFHHLKVATASISVINSPEQYFFIQIDSSSCIVQQSPKNKFKLLYPLNGPKMVSILHYIPPNASYSIVETLLRLGANPSFSDEKCRTPFRTVLAHPFPVDLIRLMYQYCKSPGLSGKHVFNVKDLDGYSPLHAAVATNNHDVVQFMLENGADPTLADKTGAAAVLEYAILNRNVRIVKLLIQHSPRMVREFCDIVKQSTVLETAMKINHEHIVQLLLDTGVDLNHRNRKQSTVLKYAIQQDAVESLQVLLDFAERHKLVLEDDIDGQGNTALQIALRQAVCPEIIQMLVRYRFTRELIQLKKMINKFVL